MAKAREGGPIVVLGSGMAGGVAVKTLREEGYGGRLVLIGPEPTLPFGRPPLSKPTCEGKNSFPAGSSIRLAGMRRMTSSWSRPRLFASTPRRGGSSSIQVKQLATPSCCSPRAAATGAWRLPALAWRASTS